jgi:hypothetical protein
MLDTPRPHSHNYTNNCTTVPLPQASPDAIFNPTWQAMSCFALRALDDKESYKKSQGEV